MVMVTGIDGDDDDNKNQGDHDNGLELKLYKARAV